MNRIKFLGIFAIAGLIALNASQFYRANAEQEGSAVGASVSASAQGLSNAGGESENSGTTLGSSQESSGSSSEGQNSQSGGTSLSISASNRVVINGSSLVSNSGQSMTVKIFGLNFNLLITSATAVIGTAQTSATSTPSVSDMKTGDVIDITGQVDATSGNITVSQIRDETMQQQNVQNIQQQIQALLDQLHKLQAQLNTQSVGQ
ncbi:MAG TPA: hypothetical protein VMV71_00760 [Candidatus Paceibacterota bacterium]|nr:hypothetical protein [Candidatus Paceibacterota bacterium]